MFEEKPMGDLDALTAKGESPLSISQLQAQLPHLEDSTLEFLAQDVRQDPGRFIRSVGQEAALAFLQALKLEFEKREHTFTLDDVIEEGRSVGFLPRRARRAVMAKDKREKRRERRRSTKR
jgi:hypothetical protein